MILGQIYHWNTFYFLIVHAYKIFKRSIIMSLIKYLNFCSLKLCIKNNFIDRIVNNI